MSGFRHDRLADVNLIADNLRDRYKDRFSILKELVQNADDAGARCIRFGMVKGDPESTNPLLQGPAVAVVNDGYFKPSDYDAIRSFGLNSKAADAATIGKFGLGMKSVFHICEGLIFIAEADGRQYRELLCPWGEELRPYWDVPEDHWATLLVPLKSACLSAVKWDEPGVPFILYLPLRRKEQMRSPGGELLGPIIEDFPGDTGELESLLKAQSTGARLASIPPLLRNLRRIQTYALDTAGNPEMKNSIDLAPDDLRPLKHHAGGQTALACGVRFAGRRLQFVGWQRHELTDRLAAIKASSAWPGSWVRNALGHAEQKPDKAQPHAAVIFGQESDPGLLIIRWATFLPIEEHEERVAMRPDVGGYSLTLHGHFFVDAGRNGLYGLDTIINDDPSTPHDEAWVRRNWNRELAGRSTLDLLIPALASFNAELGLAEERASALTAALEGSTLWRTWKREIASSQKWLRIMGKAGCKWEMITSGRTLPIPRPPENDPIRPWRVFPTLDEVCMGASVFDPDAHNLVANQNELGRWDPDQFAALLQGVNAQTVFSSSADLDYIGQFLEANALDVLSKSTVQDAICALLRRAVEQRGMASLRSVAAKIQKLAGFIPGERKIKIGLRSTAVAELLVRQSTIALPWPSELDGGEAAASPGVDDVECLLTALSTAKEHLEACRQYSEELLRQLSVDNRRTLLGRTGNLAVLSAFDCERGQKVSVSSNELRAVWNRKMLFRTGQGISDRDRAGLGPLFQCILLDQRVLVISRELAELVLETGDVDSLSACDARGVLQCLANYTGNFADSTARLELLRLVQLPDNDPRSIQGLRLLLHGRAEHRQSNIRLWVQRGNESPAWRKLWQLIVPPEDQWTVVDAELAGQIARAAWEALDLSEITPDTVVQTIRGGNDERLSSSQLEDSEYDAILSSQGWDEGTWCRLPFHQTSSGARAAITKGDTFLDQIGIQVPAALLAQATLIRQSRDPRLAALQASRIPRFDVSAAVRTALRSGSPEQWCELILVWLTMITPSAELLETIADVSWLRIDSSRAVKPKDFIDLPELENRVVQIVKRVGRFGCKSLLPEELRDHEAFRQMGDMLFPKDQSLDALARLSALDKRLCVGEVAVPTSNIDAIACLLRNAPCESVAEGWSLVHAVCDGYGVSAGASIFRAVRHQIDRLHTKRLLSWLPDQGIDSGVEAAFDLYLPSLVKGATGPSVLRDLRFRSQSGQWTPAAELSIAVPGADRASLVSERHGMILESLVNIGNGRQFEGDTAKASDRTSSDTLRSYFDPWLRRGDHIRAQVGALVSLMSGYNAELKSFASELLIPHSREWLLSELPWQLIDGDQPLDRLRPEHAIEKCSFGLFVVKAHRIPCRSLLGESIEVPAEKEANDLLCGRPTSALVANGKVHTKIVLRAVEISGLSEERLSSILQRTAESLMLCAYLRKTDLQKVWSQLNHSEQFHVTIAEELILQNLPFYLSLLKPKSSPTLARALREVDEARRLVVEYRDRPEAGGKTKDHEAQRAKLRELLRNNAEVQKAVLDAVRDKLRDSQYRLSSIPFEMFQNADDAYVQLREIRHRAGLPFPAHHDQFVVHQAGDSLSFFHWGRPVNSIGSHGFDGRERGYHRDLEKMLVLSGSEKQGSHELDAGAPVTGKFGLGFKSVLLACDRPLISSGSLHVEIVGGVLPISLSEDSARISRVEINERGSREAGPGTLIKLPNVDLALQREILSQFLKCAGYLAAFGLAIREISFTGDQGLFVARWAGRSLAGLECIECGEIPTQGISTVGTVKTLRVKVNSGTVLFGLGEDGVAILPAGTPAVWVTGPTCEDDQIGFAVCAMFDVDPGRGRLSANEERNDQLAETVGRELGAALKKLRSQPWETIRKEIGFPTGVGEYEFWNSLWSLFLRTLGRPDSSSSASRRIMTRVLEMALKDLARELPIVPNGLPGDLRRLTTSKAVRYKLAGALVNVEAVSTLFGWSVWLDRDYRPEGVVAPAIAQGLRKLGCLELTAVNLTTVGSWLQSRSVSPEEAGILGALLQSMPGQDARTQETTHDLEKARKEFASVLFYSQAGSTTSARDLLVQGQKGDEGSRAAFAPPNHRLQDKYDPKGVEFFRFCRGAMSASPVEMARWVRQAGAVAVRRAAIEYLLGGEQALEVRRQLRNQGTVGTWLDRLSEEDPWMIGLSQECQEDLRSPVVQIRSDIAPSRNSRREPHAILERIAEWWRSNSTKRVDEYNRRIYPRGRVPQLAAPGSDNFDRDGWMILFGRAAFYRLGRTSDDQHRSFMEYAERKGFWRVFAGANPDDRADEWMNVLAEFCDAEIDSTTWEHWMRSFPHFYKLSRWLEDYIELFLALDQQGRRYNLDTALTSRTQSAFQGGGVDAPPPSLGIGASFVARELLRHGQINNEYAHEHAFVPTASVRRLMREIGLEVDNDASVNVSAQIFEQISRYLGAERALFGGAYDIPLQFIAEEPELQFRLLDGTGTGAREGRE